jgi:hypothetical protein
MELKIRGDDPVGDGDADGGGDAGEASAFAHGEAKGTARMAMTSVMAGTESLLSSWTRRRTVSKPDWRRSAM